MPCLFTSRLHVSVVKLLPHIGLQVFWVSTALLNYFGDSVRRLVSTFTLKRYCPRILAQHVDDDENVMITFFET